MRVTLTPTDILDTLLVSNDPPKVRLRQARGAIMEDLQLRLPPLLGRGARPGLVRAHEATRLDGYEVAAMQQGWGLFNPTRVTEASAWALDRFVRHHVRDRAAAALETAFERHGVVEDVELLVVPADPANRNLMTRSHGLSVCAVAPGWVLVSIWPSDGNLARLDAALARATAHQRAAHRRPALETPVSLGEALAIETDAARLVEGLGFGTASRVARQLFDPPDDHRETLTAIASIYGLERYDQLDTNVYGGIDRGESSRVPAREVAPELDEDEVRYTREAIAIECATTDPVRIAACLYGDPAVRRWGHPGGGYAPLAGLTIASLDAAAAG